MITEEVIKEIYKKYKKPAKNAEELNLDYHIDLLKPNHKITLDGPEIIIDNLEEFSPFKRFLIRSLYAVLEFDKNVAFVFRGHILFFSKVDGHLSVNFKPEEKRGFFDRLFGGDDDM